MTINLKYCLLLLIYSTAFAKKAKIDKNKDKPYEVIKISIPQSIWKQALNPTPVLRSQATITVPVNVPYENEVDGDYEDEEVEEIVNTTVASDEVVQQVSATPAPANDDTVVSDVPVSDVPVSDVPVSEQPVQPVNDPPAEGPVQGQVFRFPCTCRNGQCGCCTGSILDRYSMKACGNITFVPEDFVFDVRLSVNNNTVVRRRVSASDPPPICFNPRRVPFVQVCAEISNIRIRNRNAFACLDITADIGGFPIYSASFRCFGFGSSGVQSGLKPKPISSGPKPVSVFGNDDNRESFLQSAAGALLGGGGGQSSGIFGGGNSGGILGGQGGGLFGGGGGGSSNEDDDDGPLSGIGDAIGEFFDGRNLRV